MDSGELVDRLETKADKEHRIVKFSMFCNTATMLAPEMLRTVHLLKNLTQHPSLSYDPAYHETIGDALHESGGCG